VAPLLQIRCQLTKLARKILVHEQQPHSQAA
jgi:hypothetical protein